MNERIRQIIKSVLLVAIVNVISFSSGFILMEITNIPILVIAMISSFIGMTIVSLSILVDKDSDLIKTMGHYSMLKSISIGIISLIISILILNVIPIEQSEVTSELLEPSNINLNFAIIYSVVVAPVIEELFFRATLREVITNDKDYLLASSILFALLHVGSFNLSGVIHFIATFSSGLIFARLYQKSNDIFAPMLAHSTSNFLVFFISSL